MPVLPEPLALIATLALAVAVVALIGMAVGHARLAGSARSIPFDAIAFLLRENPFAMPRVIRTEASSAGFDVHPIGNSEKSTGFCGGFLACTPAQKRSRSATDFAAVNLR